MALSAELLNLKSAGTSRSERDLTTVSNESTTYSNLRMVVGFSKQGPFNSPILITSQADFIRLFGNIDRSLEKKGSFFHRSALVALSTGPILALNLVNLDPDFDQVVEKSFSANVCEKNKNLVSLPLSSVYNTDKFWFTSDESYLDAIESYLSSETAADKNADGINSLISFTNVGKTPISILVKKANKLSTKGYELTLNDWYGAENVPEYLNGTSYVSDYMVEVYVVGGNFGPALQSPVSFQTNVDLDGDGVEMVNVYDEVDENPYSRFTSDIVYQSYFDEKGFIRKNSISDTRDTKLEKFLSLPSVKVIAKYVGSLIPNFVDKMGKNIWIQKLVNDDTDSTGLMCVENIDLIENVDVDADVINETIDLIGNNIDVITKKTNDADKVGDFLSYRPSFKANDITPSFAIIIPDGDSDSDDPEDDEYYIYERANEYDCSYKNLSNQDVKFYGWYCGSVKGSGASINGVTLTEVMYSEGKDALDEFEHVYPSKSSSRGVKGLIPVLKNGGDEIQIDICVNDSSVKDYPLYRDIYYIDGSELFTSQTGSELYVERDNEVVLPLSTGITAGDYLLSSHVSKSDLAVMYPDEWENKEEYSRLTRVKENKTLFRYDEATNKYVKAAVRVICADVIYKDNSKVRQYKTIDEYCDRLHWTCLKGFKMREDVIPDGTNDRQNMILDMLRENPWYASTKSNLFKSLIDRDNIQWRYLVDGFGLGLEESCKEVYTQLCQARQSALAIINCPSHKDFKQSKDPSFTNASGSVETEFIAEGGDRSKNPSFLFSLPVIEDGASWGAYYYPYLKISDLSAVKSVPPAAYVSNLYMNKYTRGNAWDIVAGQRRGVISGNQVIGVEATLIRDNRDWLEPVGINSIIWENGVGVEVYGNKTAKQTPKSALSSIHVREVCIYIQDNVESILRRYVFEMNTAQTRMEIKTLVDNFLETVKNNSGVYDYKTVMDTTNNTQEVIDNNMGVIDIYIEPVKGMEIIHQSLTVMKNGGIATGVFA